MYIIIHISYSHFNIFAQVCTKATVVHQSLAMFSFQGATDSEKRALCLSAENETLKQSLSVTQGLLQQLSSIPSQSSTMLIKVKARPSSTDVQLWVNTRAVTCKPGSVFCSFFPTGKREPPQQNPATGDLSPTACRAAVTSGASERTVRVEESGGAEEAGGQGEGVAAGVGQREGEGAGGEGKSQCLNHLIMSEHMVCRFLVFNFPLCYHQYVTQTVEVESPATLKQLSKAKQRNQLLSEKLCSQNERCKQLEQQIRKSDEYSCNLQHKVTNWAMEV